MSKIAVFGGTFNPFHIGHYEILKSLCESDTFDEVLVVPDRIPPHKTYKAQVPDSDRIEMCRIVCKDFSKARLCLIEFEREGKSYTVDTIKALKKIYTNGEFYVVCGGDMLKTLDTWFNFEELKKLTKFVAINRADDKSFYTEIERIRLLGANIIVLEKKITDISSSNLRVCLNKEFLPEKVWEYVNKRGIYKQQNN